jgi:hypothetical protein
MIVKAGLTAPLDAKKLPSTLVFTEHGKPSHVAQRMQGSLPVSSHLA